MFNNLNNANNQNRQAVDDIFAETDKHDAPAVPAAGVSASPTPGAEIDTQRTGLTADEGTAEEATEKRNGGRWFKIILILIIAAILILGGYLVYSKFFAVQKLDLTAMPIEQTTEETSVPVTTDNSSQVGSFVSPVGTEAEESPVDVEISIPEAVAEEIISSVGEGEETAAPATLVDSDNDGLLDEEEITAGTNINVIDTDNDGLSDYEEVRVFHTNPLDADTDGDSYLDGVEVSGGYNPNGEGKLLKENITPVKE